MSIIRISRDSGYADSIRKYKVICNNDCIGKIGNGESLEFETSPGEKEILFKIDWCCSNKIKVEVPNEGVVNLEGGSNIRSFKALLAIVYIIFLPHKYLWIYGSGVKTANKAFKRNKNSGLGFVSLHIITYNFSPLNAALDFF